MASSVPVAAVKIDRMVAEENKIEIREVSIHSDEAQLLIGLLDQELRGEYAPENMYAVDFEPFHREGGVFVVAYQGQTPIACAALRPLTETEVELKRMYVRNAHRGQGHSRQILLYLERRAKDLGYRILKLETGDQQQAAIQLYATSGYQRIAAFGEYAASDRSVCFAKQL